MNELTVLSRGDRVSFVNVTIDIQKGDRVRLVRTGDPYTTLVCGDLGTVGFIDSLGTVHVDWDCGYKLGLVPGEDSWVIL